MIIVTAGHVDHGKTSLVRHLTEVETDRLKDEQTRGLTIDLGFAYADLEDQRVGFVDVPGHIRFIHNMLAGVSGVQLALLVIAADDGPMPQTREHLAIIEALGLTSLMVAHTKVDRVDHARREASRQEISTLLSSTRFASADIIDISNASLEGIQLLRSTLCQFARDSQLPNTQASEDLKEQNFRLPIDRVFSIKGAGSVVTGTVASGAVNIGDTLLEPLSGQALRVRNIHTQDLAADQAVRGQRCALNVVPMDGGLAPLARGCWLTSQCQTAAPQRVDIEVDLFATEVKPLQHWTQLHVFHATTHAIGHLATLGATNIAPGATGLGQLSLTAPAHFCVGDRVILRDHGASRTIGAGRVIDLETSKAGRAKPSRIALLSRLAAAETRASWLQARLESEPSGLDAERLSDHLNWPIQFTEQPFAHSPLKRVGHRVFSEAQWTAAKQIVLNTLDQWHREQPNQRGFAANQLTPKLPQRFTLLKELLVEMINAKLIRLDGAMISLAGHTAALSEKAQRALDAVSPVLKRQGLQPPVLHDLAKEVGIPVKSLESLLKECAAANYLVRPTDNRFFLPDAIDRVHQLVTALDDPDGFTVQAFRDAAGIGRNLAIELLEYLDRKGVTRRDGNVRFLRR